MFSSSVSRLHYSLRACTSSSSSEILSGCRYRLLGERDFLLNLRMAEVCSLGDLGDVELAFQLPGNLTDPRNSNSTCGYILSVEIISELQSVENDALCVMLMRNCACSAQCPQTSGRHAYKFRQVLCRKSKVQKMNMKIRIFIR